MFRVIGLVGSAGFATYLIGAGEQDMGMGFVLYGCGLLCGVFAMMK